MQDKEMLTDFLSGQKMITSLYNTYAGECESAQLRDEMLTILKEEHEIQNDIFNVLQTRGYYQTKQADAQQINSAKQKLGVQ